MRVYVCMCVYLDAADVIASLVCVIPVGDCFLQGKGSFGYRLGSVLELFGYHRYFYRKLDFGLMFKHFFMCFETFEDLFRRFCISL